MDIHLDKRAIRQIRLSAQEAIEEGTRVVREDILEAFTEEQVEESSVAWTMGTFSISNGRARRVGW